MIIFQNTDQLYQKLPIQHIKFLNIYEILYDPLLKTNTHFKILLSLCGWLIHKIIFLPYVSYSLFTIVTKNVFGRKRKVSRLSKGDFWKLLKLTTMGTIFCFNGKYKKQIDGGAMWHSLRPALETAFLCNQERNWLRDNQLHMLLRYFINIMWIIIIIITIRSSGSSSSSTSSSRSSSSSSSSSSNSWIPLCLTAVFPEVSFAPLCFDSRFTSGSSSLLFPSMLLYAPAVWNVMEMLPHVTRILTWGNNAPLCCTESPKHVVFCSNRKDTSTFKRQSKLEQNAKRKKKKKGKTGFNQIIGQSKVD